MPQLRDFNDTLQFQKPHCFKIMQSTIPNAKFGLFFNGICKKDALLCGYGGQVKRLTPNFKSHYAVKLGRYPYVIDSTCYKNYEQRYCKTFSF